MPTFLITTHVPKDSTGSPEVAAAVTAWFEQLGTNLVARGKPPAERRTLGYGGTDIEPVAYTLVSAGDIDAAVALAEGCPVLGRGGSVEVRELMMLNSSL
jgi:hypothetical protein